MMYRSFLPKEQCFRGTGAEHNPQVYVHSQIFVWRSEFRWTIGYTMCWSSSCLGDFPHPKNGIFSRVDFSTHFWMVFDPNSCSIKPPFSVAVTMIHWEFPGISMATFHSEPWFPQRLMQPGGLTRCPPAAERWWPPEKSPWQSSTEPTCGQGDRQQPGQSGEAETKSSEKGWTKTRWGPDIVCWCPKKIAIL